MSLLKTKPNYAPDCIATERGWTNPKTGEVLVAIGMLKTKLAAELKETTVQVVQPVAVKTVKETTKKHPKKGQIILGEVVEHPKVETIELLGEVVEHPKVETIELLGENNLG